MTESFGAPVPTSGHPSSSHTNASGLTTEESRALPRRPAATDDERKIAAALRKLYTASFTPSTFDIYTKDAVFHDPIGIANGSDSIAAQFKGLAKMFHKSEVQSFSLLRHSIAGKPNTIFADQTIAYYRKEDSAKPFKELNSLLTLELTPDRKRIVRHTEEWNHHQQTTAADGFFGYLNEQRKKLTAGVVHKVLGGV